jgi:hypothetical protein
LAGADGGGRPLGRLHSQQIGQEPHDVPPCGHPADDAERGFRAAGSQEHTQRFSEIDVAEIGQPGAGPRQADQIFHEDRPFKQSKRGREPVGDPQAHRLNRQRIRLLLHPRATAPAGYGRSGITIDTTTSP